MIIVTVVIFLIVQNKLILSTERILVYDDIEKNINKYGGLLLKRRGFTSISSDFFCQQPGHLCEYKAKIKVLLLQSNKLSELKGGIFKGATNLKIINLNNNRLKSINESTFHGIPHLKKLSLGNNQITTIHRNAFIHATHLQELYLENNIIEVLPEELFVNVTMLCILLINDNILKKLNFDIFKHNLKLNLIDASNNKISILQGNISNLPLLTDIKLDNNTIASIDVVGFANYIINKHFISIENNKQTIMFNCREKIFLHEHKTISYDHTHLHCRNTYIYWKINTDVDGKSVEGIPAKCLFFYLKNTDQCTEYSNKFDSWYNKCNDTNFNITTEQSKDLLKKLFIIKVGIFVISIITIVCIIFTAIKTTAKGSNHPAEGSRRTESKSKTYTSKGDSDLKRTPSSKNKKQSVTGANVTEDGYLPSIIGAYRQSIEVSNIPDMVNSMRPSFDDMYFSSTADAHGKPSRKDGKNNNDNDYDNKNIWNEWV